MRGDDCYHAHKSSRRICSICPHSSASVGFDVFRCINLFPMFLPVLHNGVLFSFNGPYKIHKVITVSDWIRLKHKCDFVLAKASLRESVWLFWVRFMGKDLHKIIKGWLQKQFNVF